MTARVRLESVRVTELVKQRLGRLCSQESGGQLAEYSSRFGAADTFARIRAAVEQTRVYPELSADLDLLEHAFARNGIDGLTTELRGYQDWLGGHRPAVTAWVCPADRLCSRAALVKRGVSPPVCGLLGIPFQKQRLAP
jgi:hypothetical protein